MSNRSSLPTRSDMKIFKEETAQGGTPYYAFLCGIISFLLVMFALFLLYVICSKKYRLNWFEKDLLEKSRNKDHHGSQEILSDSMSKSDMGSFYDIPIEDKFWVPGASAKKSDDNLDSPTTPVDSKVSHFPSDGIPPYNASEPENTLQPIARSDKHIVLSTTNPVRPRVSSMNTKLSYSKFDTSLYIKEVNTAKKEETFGSIRISVSYDPAAGILSVRLIQACGLIPRDVTGTADPYAKIRLLPDRDNIWQTRVDKKTLNPVFDEDFVFELRPAAVNFRTLEIILYNFDAYSRHLSLGFARVPLSELDLSQKQTFWKNLERSSETDLKAELGSLLVSLTFLPNAERLTAVIVKARNLKMVEDSKTTTDAFVKVCLVHRGKRLKKKKTSVQKNTINPVYNEHLTFDINKEVLARSSIEFWVYHDNKMGPCEPIGKAVLSHSSSSPEDKQLFQEILNSKTAVTRWLELEDPDDKTGA